MNLTYNNFMEKQSPPEISPFRLRAGVVLIFLWWIPFWALVPALCDALGVHSSTGQRRITIAVLLLQTVIGLAGLLITGKIIANIIKHTKRRKVPGVIVYMIWHGKLKPAETGTDKKADK